MSYWVCAKDNEAMYVCEEGRLKCANSAHDDNIVNWKFDCGDRSGPHQTEHFLKPDFQGFSHAMSIAVAQMSEEEVDWLQKLITAIPKQFGKT